VLFEFFAYTLQRPPPAEHRAVRGELGTLIPAESSEKYENAKERCLKLLKRKINYTKSFL